MVNRKLGRRKPSILKPHPKNVRNHPRRQIRRICASIKQFGFTNPALIDENDVILAGHARVLAATERAERGWRKHSETNTHLMWNS